MDTSLQQLTDKIYQEGVEKGNAQAESIVAAAKKEAENIVKDAQKEAEKLAEKATKEAAETQKTALSELQMASQKAIAALKQEVTQIINGDIIDSSIKSATSDVKFLQQTIETAVKNWASSDDKALNMSVIVPEKDEEAIKNYFAKSAKGVLDKGFTSDSANNIKAGFQLAAADGTYKISFTDNDFIAFFKEFVRPKIATLLFKA